MNCRTLIIAVFMVACLASMHSYAQSSVLSSGHWYKISVNENGVYKITFDQFKKMGFGTVDPHNIQIYGNEGGMLPQPNTDDRPIDLQQLSIFVKGEDDGKFNSGDYILFYGEGADKVQFNASKEIYQYQHNLYSDKNYYYITVGTSAGKRIAVQHTISGEYPTVALYHDYFFHEDDHTSILHSGREWYGERFNDGTSQSFHFDAEGIPSTGKIKIVSDIVAQAYGADATFSLSFNGAPIGNHHVAGITDTQYGLKGLHDRDTLVVDGNTVNAVDTKSQTLKYDYSKPGSGSGYLDYFLISYERELALYRSQTIFTSSFSEGNLITHFEIKNASRETIIWDISDLYNPTVQEFSNDNQVASFNASTDVLKTFIAFNNDIPSPTLSGNVDTQNLHGLSTPNLIIVSNADFVNEAQRLADHRSSVNGWTVQVVTPEEIYNEFSSGRQDPTAIRDFVKHLYDKSPSSLRAVLMFGRGSYDYKDRLPHNTNFVPTYESRNSLSPLETYSSDDYFGMLADGKGRWSESPLDKDALDVGVGRLPVKSLEEAAVVVDKIIAYDSDKKNVGGWRKDIVFVADDGNNVDKFSRDHQTQANTMADNIEALHPEFNTRKIFVGAYPKVVKPNSESSPEVSAAIRREFYRGALIINYTGHGSEEVWADEKIFTDKDIERLDNHRNPFLVTATCEFGRNDDPGVISSAELTVLKEKGGSIGLLSSARPVFSDSNFDLNQAFYGTLFERDGNDFQTLGDVFKETKNNSLISVGNRNFALLADPSMTLAMPLAKISITTLQTADGSNTLSALSTVTAQGEVQDLAGGKMESFNGIAEVVLFDKQTDFETIGKNNPSVKFKQWYNALFRGKATVTNGAFQFQCIIPKSMAYEVGTGKLSLYAYDTNTFQTASGATEDFTIGGSSNGNATDNDAPSMEAFIGDTTFVDGGIATPNTTLVVHLRDASGMNVSNYGIGNNMVAVLDDGVATFLLDEYYVADDDTYKSGWIYYPLWDLSPGKHTITVRAWDTFNNPAQATISFVISDGENLVVNTFGNFPNPFENKTTIFFQHNRSGDDLEGEIYVYDVTGQQIKSYAFTSPASPYQVNVVELNDMRDFGKKLPGGLYFARLTVRSLSNGSKSEQVTKLIILN